MDDVVVPAEAANWAALPRDVGYEIFRRLPHRDILESAGLVCSSWRRLAVEEPMLWRHIDIAFDWKEYRVPGLEVDELYKTPARLLAMARAAVDRSAGRCESFRGPVDGRFLLHLGTKYQLFFSLSPYLWLISHSNLMLIINNVFLMRICSAPSLRRLHVTSFFRLENVLVDRVVSKLAMLERLVLHGGLVISTTLRAFLDHCPRLELLDAGGCFLETTRCSSLLASLSEVKVLVLPRRDLPFMRDPLYIWMEAWDTQYCYLYYVE